MDFNVFSLEKILISVVLLIARAQVLRSITQNLDLDLDQRTNTMMCYSLDKSVWPCNTTLVLLPTANELTPTAETVLVFYVIFNTNSKEKSREEKIKKAPSWPANSCKCVFFFLRSSSAAPPGLQVDSILRHCDNDTHLS